MKLLFDQNISFRAVGRLWDEFPNARHVKEFELDSASDGQIWNYAKENKFTIVTFDADFFDFVTLYGHPPKVIWLRIGNTSSRNLIKIFLSNSEVIKEFIADDLYKDMGCLEIDQ